MEKGDTVVQMTDDEEYNTYFEDTYCVKDKLPDNGIDMSDVELSPGDKLSVLRVLSDGDRMEYYYAFQKWTFVSMSKDEDDVFDEYEFVCEETGRDMKVYLYNGKLTYDGDDTRHLAGEQPLVVLKIEKVDDGVDITDVTDTPNKFEKWMTDHDVDKQIVMDIVSAVFRLKEKDFDKSESQAKGFMKQLERVIMNDKLPKPCGDEEMDINGYLNKSSQLKFKQRIERLEKWMTRVVEAYEHLG